MKLQEEVTELKNDFKKVSFFLNNIEQNNVFEQIGMVNNVSKDILFKKNQLLENFPLEKLKLFNKEFDIFIKQIQKKFDSMIQENKIKQRSISNELKNLLNKKKLVKYGR